MANTTKARYHYWQTNIRQRKANNKAESYIIYWVENHLKDCESFSRIKDMLLWFADLKGFKAQLKFDIVLSSYWFPDNTPCTWRMDIRGTRQERPPVVSIYTPIISYSQAKEFQRKGNDYL